MITLPVLLLTTSLLGATPLPAPSTALLCSAEPNAGSAARSELVPVRPDVCPEVARTDPRLERASLGADVPDFDGHLSPAQVSTFAAFPIDAPLHGEGTAGARVVRGRTYRAHFDAAEARYVPFFGSRAPRSFPVAFALDSVEVAGHPVAFEREVPAARDAERVSYARGSLTEHYDVGVDSVEQSFVFDELPDRGEILLRIGVETDLVASETGAGIEFSNEFGMARYGRATAIDARGASTPAETRWTGTGIEIRVPADFVANASLPLVVDPLLGTFAVGSPGPEYRGYDCAFDASTGRWLVVYEDLFDEFHTQVVWRLFGLFGGAPIASGLVGDDTTGIPHCANNNAADQFLVVARSDWMGVFGQRISAAGTLVGSPFSLGLGYNQKFVVGGDPYPGTPSSYLVGWPQSGSTTDSIQYKMVQTNGTVGAVQTLWSVDAGYDIERLAVSKSNGAGTWNLAWTYGSPSQTFDTLEIGRVAWNGLPLGTSFVNGTGVSPYGGLSASMALDGTDRWVVAFERSTFPYVNGADVHMLLLDGLNVIDDENVSLLIERAGSGSRLGDQRFPSVDSDGRSFAVTFTDRSSTPNTITSGWGPLRVATLTPVGNQIQLSEVTTISTADKHPAVVASTKGAGLAWRLQLAVYAEASTGDVQATLYDDALFTSFCHPGYDGVATCPCGNAPSQFGRGCNNSSNTGGAALYGTGISSVTNDSMQLIATNLPTNQTVFFYQGTTPLTTAVFSGRGLRCVGGTVLNLYTKPALPLGTQAYASAPNPGDARITARSSQLGYAILPGSTRYYFATYRPTGTSGGGNGLLACSNPYASNVTQSIQAVWIP